MRFCRIAVANSDSNVLTMSFKRSSFASDVKLNQVFHSSAFLNHSRTFNTCEVEYCSVGFEPLCGWQIGKLWIARPSHSLYRVAVKAIADFNRPRSAPSYLLPDKTKVLSGFIFLIYSTTQTFRKIIWSKPTSKWRFNTIGSRKV